MRKGKKMVTVLSYVILAAGLLWVSLPFVWNRPSFTVVPPTSTPTQYLSIQYLLFGTASFIVTVYM